MTVLTVVTVVTNKLFHQNTYFSQFFSSSQKNFTKNSFSPKISKAQIVMKLKNSNCDEPYCDESETQKQKF